MDGGNKKKKYFSSSNFVEIPLGGKQILPSVIIVFITQSNMDYRIVMNHYRNQMGLQSASGCLWVRQKSQTADWKDAEHQLVWSLLCCLNPVNISPTTDDPPSIETSSLKASLLHSDG